MKKPYLSIIIPAYNSAKTLPALLASIFASSFADFEVILVDDGSVDDTKEVSKNFNLRYFFIKNAGPGGARDFGAREARGEILVFFDADVSLFPETLEKIAQAFENEKTVAITGIWDKRQRRKDFFPRYKALRDWSYWFNEDSGSNSYVFSTRVSAIRKKVFLKEGGFVGKERGRNALEDLDFTYRVAQKYMVEFAPEARVHHEFDGANEMLTKFFKRSFKYAKLFLHYRQFSRSGYTPSESLAGALALFIPVFLFMGFFWQAAWLIASFLFLFHLYFERKFLAFALKEEGLIFAIKSVLAGFIVYFIVYAAAGLSVFHSGWLILKKKI